MRKGDKMELPELFVIEKTQGDGVKAYITISNNGHIDVVDSSYHTRNAAQRNLKVYRLEDMERVPKQLCRSA